MQMPRMRTKQKASEALNTQKYYVLSIECVRILVVPGVDVSGGRATTYNNSRWQHCIFQTIR